MTQAHSMTMTVRITNLRLRCIIGIYEWERNNPQDVVINMQIRYDAHRSQSSDSIHEALDYKVLAKKIISLVETSSFNLIETLAARVIELPFEDPRTKYASVRIDKPQALRFCDSVSIECEKSRC